MTQKITDSTKEMAEITKETEKFNSLKRIVAVQLKIEQLVKENKLERDLCSPVLSEWFYGEDECYLLNPKDYTFDADEEFFYIYYTKTGQLKYKWRLTDLYEEIED